MFDWLIDCFIKVEGDSWNPFESSKELFSSYHLVSVSFPRHFTFGRLCLFKVLILVGVEGIVPKDSTMPSKSPVMRYQIVSRIVWLRVYKNRAHNLNDDLKQTIIPSIFCSYTNTAFAISFVPYMKCMPFIARHPCDFPKSNNLQPFNWLCIINWS